MKALVKFKSGVGNVELRDVEMPKIGDNEVLIKVKVAGVCGTDVHIYYDHFRNNPPVILGHEFSGVITKVGRKVSKWRPGDRVVSENNPYACRECQLCRMGYPNLCSKKKAMGILSNGCFAEYLKLPAWLLHKIPDNVTDEQAALSEPTAVAMHSVVERGKLEIDDFVVVFGPGTIGLLAAQVAKASGASKVMIIGTDADVKMRLRVAYDLGIDYIVNAQQENPLEMVMDITHGRGADMIVEASGSNKVIAEAIKLVRRRGRITAPGLTGKRRISVPWDSFILKGIEIVFPYSSNYISWKRTLSQISLGKIKGDPLITDRFPLTGWKKAFRKLKELQTIKPLLYETT